ncbi:glutaminyl-peptide cyclotransferase [Sphingobacterium sp. SRCM116780]|uniref:glutaminyl-peptide cyclotransferase n=1 Tax=Sphingobacterium sp. SRCM116780 TaxID=2907623 RepID=UPI001F351E63|nr:glutaminyl-peptide cyclotransferase [Sphingobacterium sp. SRCM116780]UIR55567.1 glutaminyl-peptide cyclotransferase [Sphingobacterium sp. SRCM116780]
MKKTKYILLGLVLSLGACKTQKSGKLEFAKPDASQSIQQGDPIQLQLKFTSSDFDSVVYYIDNQVVGSKKDTVAVQVDSKNFTFGSRNISAKLYQGAKVDSASGLIYIVPQAPKEYGFEVVNKFLHDTTAYTQGLQYENGMLYESTGSGNNTITSLRRVDLKTGKVLQKKEFDSQKYFGEGMTIVGDKIVMLTWQNMEGFVLNKSDFELVKTFPYTNSKEGWGLTYDGKRLIKSDGSNKLYFLDANTQAELSSIEVYDENGKVDALNELEYIDGKIYANVYEKDIIVIINPETGAVEGRINLVGIYQHAQYDNELNGIAYDQAGKRLFITGKLWNTLFEIKMIAR